MKLLFRRLAASSIVVVLTTTGSHACMSLEKDLADIDVDPEVTVIEVFQEPIHMLAAKAALPRLYRSEKGLLVRERELEPLDALLIAEFASGSPEAATQIVVTPYFHGQCRGQQQSRILVSREDAEALARAVRRFD